MANRLNGLTTQKDFAMICDVKGINCTKKNIKKLTIKAVNLNKNLDNL